VLCFLLCILTRKMEKSQRPVMCGPHRSVSCQVRHPRAASSVSLADFDMTHTHIYIRKASFSLSIANCVLINKDILGYFLQKQHVKSNQLYVEIMIYQHILRYRRRYVY
jgi:hypothetical protein